MKTCELDEILRSLFLHTVLVSVLVPRPQSHALWNFDESRSLHFHNVFLCMLRVWGS